MNKIFGRDKEIEILKEVEESNKSEFIAVYGRRRIGKTFLIDTYFKDKFFFRHTGIFNKNNKEQLKLFYTSLVDAGYSGDVPKDWYDAFHILRQLVLSSKLKKKVIFIDELSWMDAKNSSMISALENFWNKNIASNGDVILIIASSSTSWIVNKVLCSKGGLYNRLTRRIYLKEFTLKQVKDFLNTKIISYSYANILDGYLAIGGIPYYWDLIKKSESIVSFIDRMFFKEDAELNNEFNNLFNSLFNNPEPYMKIIETLGNHKSGLTKIDLIKMSKLTENGRSYQIIDDLESCSFIRVYKKYTNIHEEFVQLIDNFILFYFRFIKSKKNYKSFINIINTPDYYNFRGLSFEIICLKHIEQIKSALGIRNVDSQTFSMYQKGNDISAGYQIDMFIDRDDQIINLLEMKYCNDKYELSLSETLKLQNRVENLMKISKYKKGVQVTIVTPYGLVDNSHSSFISSVITLDDLFKI